MSKPLELTVHEIDGTEPSMVVIGGFWAYRPYDPAKRLTDAELAAEYWRAGDDMAETNYDRDVNAEPVRRILSRFATLPHYAEVKP